MTWSNKFLQLYHLLPNDLRELNLKKKKGKNRLLDWIGRIVETFIS